MILVVAVGVEMLGHEPVYIVVVAVVDGVDFAQLPFLRARTR